MRSSLRCLGLLLLVFLPGGPADLQGQADAPPSFRFGGVSTLAAGSIRVQNGSVSISVPASAFNPVTGQALVTDVRAISAEVNCNRSWTLRVRADRATFSNNHGYNFKPCSDLSIRRTGQSSYQPVATSPRTVTSGGPTPGWQPITFDLTFAASTDDSYGTYTLNLLFDFAR